MTWRGRVRRWYQGGVTAAELASVPRPAGSAAGLTPALASSDSALPRLHAAVELLATSDVQSRAKAAQVLLELVSDVWEDTAAAAVPPVSAQPDEPPLLAVSPQGPMAVAPIAHPSQALVEAVAGVGELEPLHEAHREGTLTILRPHPDVEPRWCFQPCAGAPRWRVLLARLRSAHVAHR